MLIGRGCESSPSRGAGLESLARNKNEEDAESSVYQHSDGKNHESSLGKELADIGFPNAGKVEGGVFAETEQRQDGVKRVLVRSEEVHSHSKRQDELGNVSIITK